MSPKHFLRKSYFLFCNAPPRIAEGIDNPTRCEDVCYCSKFRYTQTTRDVQPLWNQKLSGGQTFAFNRAKERLRLGVIVAVAQPTHT